MKYNASMAGVCKTLGWEFEGTEFLQNSTEQPQEIHPSANAQTDNSNWHEKPWNRNLPVGQIQSWEAIVAIYPCQWYLPQLNQYHVTSREIEGTELIVNLQKGTEQPQEIHPSTNAQTGNSNWHERATNGSNPEFVSPGTEPEVSKAARGWKGSEIPTHINTQSLYYMGKAEEQNWSFVCEVLIT